MTSQVGFARVLYLEAAWYHSSCLPQYTFFHKTLNKYDIDEKLVSQSWCRMKTFSGKKSSLCSKKEVRQKRLPSSHVENRGETWWSELNLLQCSRDCSCFNLTVAQVTLKMMQKRRNLEIQNRKISVFNSWNQRFGRLCCAYKPIHETLSLISI